MNIAPNVEELNEADWKLADIEEGMSPGEIQEHIDSFAWEKMHYEKVLNEFGKDTRQGRYASHQIAVIDVIVERLEAALQPAPRSYTYAEAS
jgi:hypothetical protein